MPNHRTSPYAVSEVQSILRVRPSSKANLLSWLNLCLILLSFSSLLLSWTSAVTRCSHSLSLFLKNASEIKFTLFSLRPTNLCENTNINRRNCTGFLFVRTFWKTAQPLLTTNDNQESNHFTSMASVFLPETIQGQVSLALPVKSKNSLWKKWVSLKTTRSL